MNHPMEPTPEQLAEWLAKACRVYPNSRPGDIAGHVARLAYAAGADAELEACCEWVDTPVDFEDYRPGEESKHLRADRRPAASLKQRGRDALELIKSGQWDRSNEEPFDVLSRAIEALPEEAP